MKLEWIPTVLLSENYLEGLAVKYIDDSMNLFNTLKLIKKGMY